MEKVVSFSKASEDLDYELIAVHLAIEYKKLYDQEKRKSGKPSNLFFVKYDSSSELKIKKHKWFEAFLIIAKRHGIQKDFNPRYFMRSAFEKNGLIFPHQLKGTRAWSDYLDLKNKYEEIEESSKIPFIEKVNSKCSRAFTMIKHLGGAESFVDKNINLILNNSIEIYPIIFSKYFRKWVDKNLPTIPESVFLKIRRINSITIPLINSSQNEDEKSKIKKEIKSSLGDEDYTEEAWNI